MTAAGIHRLKTQTFFPNIPSLSVLQSSSSTVVPTIYKVAPDLHAPYTMQSVISVERQISKVMNATVTYVNARSVHQLLADNINAPEIDDVPTPSGVRPLGVLENVFEYRSEGIFKQNQLIANFNVRAGTKVTLNGYYSLSYADSDTSGANSFPTDPYNISADYGRAGFDVRNRAYVGGTISAPFGIRLNPFMVMASGSPFNVTAGTDLNGDSILNDQTRLRFGDNMPRSSPVSTNIECTRRLAPLTPPPDTRPEGYSHK